MIEIGEHVVFDHRHARSRGNCGQALPRLLWHVGADRILETGHDDNRADRLSGHRGLESIQIETCPRVDGQFEDPKPLRLENLKKPEIGRRFHRDDIARATPCAQGQREGFRRALGDDQALRIARYAGQQVSTSDLLAQLTIPLGVDASRLDSSALTRDRRRQSRQWSQRQEFRRHIRGTQRNDFPPPRGTHHILDQTADTHRTWTGRGSSHTQLRVLSAPANIESRSWPRLDPTRGLEISVRFENRRNTHPSGTREPANGRQPIADVETTIVDLVRDHPRNLLVFGHPSCQSVLVDIDHHCICTCYATARRVRLFIRMQRVRTTETRTMRSDLETKPDPVGRMTMKDDGARIGELLSAAGDAAGSFLDTIDHRPAAVSPEPPSTSIDLTSHGVGAIEAITEFRERHEAGISGSAGPRYLGFVTGGVTPAALVGDWLSAAYDQNPAIDGDSIASTVEREALQLLRQLFGIPARFDGSFTSGATLGNVVALATARQVLLARAGVDVARDGLYGHPPIAVLGGSPHASIEKAMSMLGMGRRHLESTPSLPGRVAIDVDALDARLSRLDERPAIVVASSGDVNTGDFDDLRALAVVCRRHAAWLHVDGAFGLFAACDPDRAHLLDGLEQADSIVSDGHKWLNVPYDAGFVFTRHLRAQERVFRASAAYLGTGPDLLHRSPEGSRRMRSLPTWMTLRAYGRAGYRDLVRRNCRQAAALGHFVTSSESFELLAPVRFNVVCFALADGARNNAADHAQLLERLIHDGRTFLTATVFEGRPGLRAAFVNWRTREADIAVICDALSDAAQT